MALKIIGITFADKQHRIAHLHIGQQFRASDKVSMELQGPFVVCKFTADPGHQHLVPISGISDIWCEEKDAQESEA